MNSRNSHRQQISDSKIAQADPKKEMTPGWIMWAKLLGSLAALLIALVYAVGYLCQLGHEKMLGISQVEHVPDKVIQDGAVFFLRGLLCAVIPLAESWVSLAVSLLLLSAPVLWLIRCNSPTPRLRVVRLSLRLLQVLGITAFLVSHGLFFFLSQTILSQKDLLFAVQSGLPDEKKAALFTRITCQPAELSKLLEGGGQLFLYGALFLLFVSCSLWWMLIIIKFMPRSMPETTSRYGRIFRILGLLVSFFFMILLFIIQINSCGFLVKPTEYPVICLEETAHQSFPDGLVGEDLFVLGYHRSRTLLYSACHKKIWWVLDSQYLPASQSKPARNLFGQCKNGESGLAWDKDSVPSE